MINFLVFVSLIFNVISLLAIIILYLRQNRLAIVEKKQEQLINEMEETISSFLIEMKDDNERFIQTIRELEKRQVTSVPVKSVKEENKPHKNLKNREKEELEKPDRIRTATAIQAVRAYTNSNNSKDLLVEDDTNIELPPLDLELEIELTGEENSDAVRINKPDDFQMELLLNQALMLKRQGLSEEEIAKKLNKGKTEIELLFKFRQKESE